MLAVCYPETMSHALPRTSKRTAALEAMEKMCKKPKLPGKVPLHEALTGSKPRVTVSTEPLLVGFDAGTVYDKTCFAVKGSVATDKLPTLTTMYYDASRKSFVRGYTDNFDEDVQIMNLKMALGKDEATVHSVLGLPTRTNFASGAEVVEVQVK